MASSDRPLPLREVASKVGVAWAVVSGVISALVAFGVLTSATGHAIQAAGDALPSTIVALGTVIAGIAPIVAGIAAAFHTAKAGADHVTPISSPMGADPATGRLVPLVPLGRAAGPVV
jgi:hypothetical protein